MIDPSKSEMFSVILSQATRYAAPGYSSFSFISRAATCINVHSGVQLLLLLLLWSWGRGHGRRDWAEWELSTIQGGVRWVERGTAFELNNEQWWDTSFDRWSSTEQRVSVQCWGTYRYFRSHLRKRLDELWYVYNLVAQRGRIESPVDERVQLYQNRFQSIYYSIRSIRQ